MAHTAHMGTLSYGAERTQIRVDDRLLSHLQAVMVAKLRRDESILLTIPGADDGGPTSVWVHPGHELIFDFDEEVTTKLERELLERLAVSANSSTGLDLGADAALVDS